MPSQEHTHTYGQYKKRPGYFKCLAPNCSHFTERELVLGKYSCCTSCGQEFILTYADLRRVKPRCIDCSETAKAKLKKASESIVRGIFSPGGAAE